MTVGNAEKVKTEDARWQPIETAPKDGAGILIADCAGHYFAVRQSPDGFLVGTPFWPHDPDPCWVVYEGNVEWTATHWRPLPAPPPDDPEPPKDDEDEYGPDREETDDR